MKKLLMVLMLALALAAQVMTAAPAAAEDWAVDFDATYNTKYVWRGILLVDDPVLQPSVNISKYGLTFNVWGSMELTDVNDYGAPYGSGKGKFTEVDLTLDYTFALGDFSIPVGVIHYLFPNTSFASTTEIYAGVSYDFVVSPSLTIYHDIEEANGNYVSLGLSYSIALPVKSKDYGASIDLGASLAYGDSDYNVFYFGVDKSAWTDWSISLAVPITVGKYVTVTPAVTHTALIDSELQDTTENDSNTYFGISVTVSF